MHVQAIFIEPLTSDIYPSLVECSNKLVTGIFKHRDASDPANYRPIAAGMPLCRPYINVLHHC